MLLTQYDAGLHHHVTSAQVDAIRSLWRDAGAIAGRSLPHLQRNDPEYYSKLWPLVETPMMLAKDYRRIDLNLRWSGGSAKRKAGQCNPSVSCRRE